MKPPGLIICVFLVKNLIFSQTSIEGFYRGIITQNYGGLSTKYYMDLSLRLTNDKKIVGESFFQMFEDKNVFVRFDVQGYTQDNQLILEEVKIQYQQIYEYASFCYKKMVLEFTEENGQQVLSGTWTSKNCNGSTGKITLLKEFLF